MVHGKHKHSLVRPSKSCPKFWNAFRKLSSVVRKESPAEHTNEKYKRLAIVDRRQDIRQQSKVLDEMHLMALCKKQHTRNHSHNAIWWRVSWVRIEMLKRGQ